MCFPEKTLRTQYTYKLIQNLKKTSLKQNKQTKTTPSQKISRFLIPYKLQLHLKIWLSAKITYNLVIDIVELYEHLPSKRLPESVRLRYPYRWNQMANLQNSLSGLEACPKLIYGWQGQYVLHYKLYWFTPFCSLWWLM